MALCLHLVVGNPESDKTNIAIAVGTTVAVVALLSLVIVCIIVAVVFYKAKQTKMP